MNKTNIAWTDYTWNPITGCSAVSAGCANCYAKTVHERFNDTPFSEIMFHEDRLDEPLKRKKPAKIFVGSMTDMFQDGVTYQMLDSVFRIIMCSPQHTFQILTKRPERMRDYFKSRYDRSEKLLKSMLKITPHVAAEMRRANIVLPNLWLGVTAENQEQADKRIPVLMDTPAVKRFVSVEPMIGPVRLTLIPIDDVVQTNFLHEKHSLDWVIVGGESGGKDVRPMEQKWVKQIYDDSRANNVPFFFKQWGAHKPYLGKEPCFEYETIQEFPKKKRI